MVRSISKLSLAFMLLGALAGLDASAAVLRGTVKDAGGEPLIQASVRVLAVADSAVVRAGITNDNGRFSIDRVNPGNYIVEVSYIGYESQYRNVQLGERNVTLQPFSMSENSIALREATVVGQRTPVKVMQDTVEFNAEAYRTQPNAVVEDLLKRLPGVEVSSDGSITANGKSVSKILVEGKEFFSDDPTVASRNLPVDMVERLQVVDRKSDLARMTGVDDGEEETVINLTVKKDRKNGWFGNIEGGYGTDDRYKGNLTVNRFWNGNQLTILGSANNINEPGAADGAAGRFRHFGGQNGIKATQSAGVNFNVGKEEIFRVGGNVLYSHGDQHTLTSSNRTYLFADSTSTVASDKNSRDRTHNFRVDLRMVWMPDSFNTLEFRPNFTYSNSNSSSSDSSLTRAGDAARSLVTRSINRGFDRGHSVEFGGRLIYNHNFKRHRGRSFSLFVNYKYSDVRVKSDNYSFNRFFLNDSMYVYDQFADNNTWSNSLNARASWTEPLGDAAKGHYLTFAYSINFRWNNADKLVYDHPITWPDGFDSQPVVGSDEIFSQALSNSFRNNFFSQDIRVGYRRVTKKANFNVGISLVPQQSKSINLINSDKTIPLRRVLNVAPFLRYRYKFNRTRSLAANYNGRSSQPSMTQLQPVADVSDPLRVVIGNPQLNPSFTHNAMLRFQDFNQDAQRSIMLMMHAQMTQNAIISRTDFNSQTGGQTTTYENVSGIWNMRLMNMVSLPFKNRAFSFTNHFFFNFASNVGYNNSLRNRSNSFSINESPGLAWRPANLEIEIRPRYSVQFLTNSVRTNANRTVHTYGGSFYANYTLPFGVNIGTDLNYDATSGYSDGYDTRTWMWNASLSYSFLKAQNATVSVKAYDILGQKSNVRRSVTANYIDDSRYNSLTRYVMLTVAYKFNTFGKGNEPADMNRDRRFPGPPPGGGRTMGPPPGGGRGPR